MQTGLPIALQANVAAGRLQRGSWAFHIANMQAWQCQCKPVGMPQAELRMHAQHQRAGLQTFCPGTPLLKRKVRRPVRRIQRPAAPTLCQRVSDAGGPSVQWIGLPVREKCRSGKRRPALGSGHANHPDHSGGLSIGQRRQGIVRTRNPPTTQAQAKLRQRRFNISARRCSHFCLY